MMTFFRLADYALPQFAKEQQKIADFLILCLITKLVILREKLTRYYMNNTKKV